MFIPADQKRKSLEEKVGRIEIGSSEHQIS